MERIINFLFCSKHPEHHIEWVDTINNAQNILYCGECMLALNSDHRKSSISLIKFLTNAAELYSKSKLHLSPLCEPPLEFTKVMLSKSENLEKLTKHIQYEKNKIDDKYDHMLKQITETITKMKDEKLGILDNQIRIFEQHYASFDKLLRKTYPKSEELSELFPTKDGLIQRINKMENLSQLSACFRNIIEDINSIKENESLEINQRRVNSSRLSSIAKVLQSVESSKPSFEIQNIDISSLKSTIKQYLDDFLGDKLVPKDLIPEVIQHTPIYPKSSIITNQEFEILRGWVPEDYEFTPRLLYKLERDRSDFHKKCDNQGPTITIIKCQFDGSPKLSIIGGFLDKSWHNKNSNIPSKKAFVFSLTSKIKCPILQEHIAAYGGGGWGISFGSGGINIKEDLSKAYCSHTCYYENINKIIDLKDKEKEVNFVVKDIEVYALN